MLDAGVPPELPALSLLLEPGAVRAIAVEGDERPKLLSMLLGGRLRPTEGVVLADGSADPRVLRRGVALVAPPFASEPAPGVALRVAVAEELGYAGRRAGRHAVERVLVEHGLADDSRTPVELVPAAARIRLLAELALRRPGVEALVLTSPERHGGDPAEWSPVLADIARRGIAVGVVTDRPTASLLLSHGVADARPLQESA